MAANGNKFCKVPRTVCRLVSFLAGIFFIGCGPKGPSFYQIESSIPVLTSGYGRLYFLNTAGTEARLALDRNPLGKCRSGAFFWEDLPAGSHVVTADNWGHPGAWHQNIDVIAGQDHYILIKNRRAASVAQGLFGVVGTLAEAAVATEGQSGPFEAQVLDEISGKEERAKLVFFRDGYVLPQKSPSPQPPSVTTVSAKAPTSAKVVVTPSPARSEAVAQHGSCSVEQILSLKGAGLSDSQIKAACR